MPPLPYDTGLTSATGAAGQKAKQKPHPIPALIRELKENSSEESEEEDSGSEDSSEEEEEMVCYEEEVSGGGRGGR